MEKQAFGRAAGALGRWGGKAVRGAGKLFGKGRATATSPDMSRAAGGGVKPPSAAGRAAPPPLPRSYAPFRRAAPYAGKSLVVGGAGLAGTLGFGAAQEGYSRFRDADKRSLLGNVVRMGGATGVPGRWAADKLGLTEPGFRVGPTGSVDGNQRWMDEKTEGLIANNRKANERREQIRELREQAATGGPGSAAALRELHRLESMPNPDEERLAGWDRAREYGAAGAEHAQDRMNAVESQRDSIWQAPRRLFNRWTGIGDANARLERLAQQRERHQIMRDNAKELAQRTRGGYVYGGTEASRARPDLSKYFS